MILCGLNDSVRITLELAQVLSDAVVKNTREAAIASLIADPEPRIGDSRLGILLFSCERDGLAGSMAAAASFSARRASSQ